MTFYSETENQYWEAKFQFHKGNTLVETQMLKTEDSDEKEMNEIGWDTIWRD